MKSMCRIECLPVQDAYGCDVHLPTCLDGGHVCAFAYPRWQRRTEGSEDIYGGSALFAPPFMQDLVCDEPFAHKNKEQNI